MAHLLGFLGVGAHDEGVCAGGAPEFKPADVEFEEVGNLLSYRVEDYETSVVGFSCGFELCDDAALERCGADVDCGEPVFEIIAVR